MQINSAAATTVTRPIRVVFLPNVRQANRREGFIPGQSPDPNREFAGFRANHVLMEERDLNRFPWNPLAKKGTFYAGFDLLRALKVLLFDRKADVIVSVFETNIFFILLLRRVFFFKPKLVLWEVSGRGWSKRDRVLDYVVPRVDQALTLTSIQQKHTAAFYRMRGTTELIGFAIDDQFFSPRPSTRDDQGYVLAVGDDGGRDYATLIEACRGIDCRLLLRTGLKVHIPEDLTSFVTIVGRLNYVELRDLYAGSAVVVAPLKPVDYPSGITAIFEAMAMGKCLIASKTGVVADFISDGQNGILVEPSNAVALREAIAEALNNDHYREKLGQAARESIDRKFSYNAYIALFSNKLHGLVKSLDR